MLHVHGILYGRKHVVTYVWLSNYITDNKKAHAYII